MTGAIGHSSCSLLPHVPPMWGRPPRPARSVHLWWWDGPHPSRFAYNEVVVTHSCPGTYFCVLGWDGGYAGLQELGDRRKVAIFSCWDVSEKSADDMRADPNQVPLAQRCVCLEKDAVCDYARFGKEGTGARCLMPFEWRTGVRYRFLVRESEELHGCVGYTCWCAEESSPWRLIAHVTVPKPAVGIRGLYSFVEDFGRAGYHTRHRCLFGPCITQPLNHWQEEISAKVKFTAAGEEGHNISASVEGGRFVLETGGDIRQTVPLDGEIECRAVARRARFDLPWQYCIRTNARREKKGANELSCAPGEEFVLNHTSGAYWEGTNVLTGEKGWLPHDVVQPPIVNK